MTRFEERSAPVWRSALRWLAALSLALGALNAKAACDIPQWSGSEKPYSDVETEQSFVNQDCELIYLTEEVKFYRYYSFVPPETASTKTNIGRFLTLDFFTINSQAIVELALYPFTPKFQNFAYYRELVTIMAGVELYKGIAGPQPYNDSGSCYAGGATQYFFAGDNISNNPLISFTFDNNMQVDYQYTNQFGYGDPCNVSEPATPQMLGLGLMMLATMAGMKRRARRKIE